MFRQYIVDILRSRAYDHETDCFSRHCLDCRQFDAGTRVQSISLTGNNVLSSLFSQSCSVSSVFFIRVATELNNTECVIALILFGERKRCSVDSNAPCIESLSKCEDALQKNSQSERESIET